MLWVPKKGPLRVEHNTGAVGVGAPGTAVTTHASSASTKGTPVQLIGATAFDAYWMRIIALGYGTSAVASAGALDILIGAATEEVLIPNLLMGYCGSLNVAGTGPKYWDFPLYIPAGSRLAAQVAGERLNAACNIAIFLYGGDGYPPFRVGQKVTTYGMGTVPNGTVITPGASGAEGSWAQITSGTSEDHFAVVPSFQVSAADSNVNIRVLAVDVGVGAATEEEVGQSYWFNTDAQEVMSGPHNSMPTFLDIPSGTRLAMRASNQNPNDSYDGALHCLS
jgi:hypothetical protein